MDKSNEVICINTMNYTGNKIKPGGTYILEEEFLTTYKLQGINSKYTKDKFISKEQFKERQKYFNNTFGEYNYSRIYFYVINNEYFISANTGFSLSNYTSRFLPNMKVETKSVISMTNMLKHKIVKNWYIPSFHIDWHFNNNESIHILDKEDLKERLNLLLKINILEKVNCSLRNKTYIRIHEDFKKLYSPVDYEIELGDLLNSHSIIEYPYLYNNYGDEVIIKSTKSDCKNMFQFNEDRMILFMFFNKTVTKEIETDEFNNLLKLRMEEILSFKFSKYSKIKQGNFVNLKKEIHCFTKDKKYEVFNLKEVRKNLVIAKLQNDYMEFKYINTIYLKNVETNKLFFLHSIKINDLKNIKEKNTVFRNYLFFHLLLKFKELFNARIVNSFPDIITPKLLINELIGTGLYINPKKNIPNFFEPSFVEHQPVKNNCIIKFKKEHRIEKIGSAALWCNPLDTNSSLDHPSENVYFSIDDEESSLEF